MPTKKDEVQERVPESREDEGAPAEQPFHAGMSGTSVDLSDRYSLPHATRQVLEMADRNRTRGRR